MTAPIPGSKTLAKLTATRVPANAVVFVGVCAAILTRCPR